ncbi:MAG: YcaO-like family protein [Chloroflexi bacterium]|nr:YcaO-like family protein [Chloroflexota bacterium]
MGTSRIGLEQVVSPCLGIVRTLSESRHTAENARLHVISAETGEIAEVLGGGSTVVGGGANTAHLPAVQSAIGEVLERYSAKWVPPGSRVLASYRELRGPAARPLRFALFHDAQYADPGFPYVPFNESTRVAWTQGIDLATGAITWLPSQLVYLHHDPGDLETRVSYSTSSGLACEQTHDKAVLKALLEVLERDADMLVWYCRMAPPRIEISDDPVLSRLEAAYFRVYGVRHVAFDLSAIHRVPTVLAMVTDEDPTTATAAFGSACALEPRTAWLKAVTEAYHTRTWAVQLRRTRQDLLSAPADVRSLEDHVRFYSNPANLRHLEFLWGSPIVRTIAEIPSLPVMSPREAIDYIANELRASEICAVAIDVTAPDVREAGFSVARVISPELCKLDVSYGTRYLGGPRLYSAREKPGLASRTLQIEDLNPYPHPFP